MNRSFEAINLDMLIVLVITAVFFFVLRSKKSDKS